MSKFTIALAGNPNSGKTTLFNNLTGGRQQTGNWPGVTVERIEGDFSFEGSDIHVIDLPGIYSLAAYSEDEQVSRDYILSHSADLIVNIIDASNIERNLYLTTHLLEMNVPMMIVLNMKDVATAKEIYVNTEKLSQALNIPIEYISATKKTEMNSLKEIIIRNLNSPTVSNAYISYENELEEAIATLTPFLEEYCPKIGAPARWMAVKLLEDDTQLEERLSNEGLNSSLVSEVKQTVAQKVGDDTDILIADGRYGFIHGVVKSTVTRGEVQKSLTDKIDNVVLNRFWGIPIFAVVMYLVFWGTINLGGAFIDFFDTLFGTLFVESTAAMLNAVNAPEWLVAFLSTGIGGGIQTVANFVPIIFMLFFILSILEDSGYMARAAFVMDRLMRAIGLPGKAFIPLVVGFGCTVPAIMATRTLDNKRDRLLTIFMSPFMSCGARLQVYALFAAAFFPRSGQNIVFLLYLIGIVLAVLTGLFLKKTLFAGDASPLVMELPMYHAPRLGHIFIHTWEKLKGFVLSAGKILIIIITILGFLNSLGTDGTFGNENTEKSVLATAGKKVTPLFSSFGVEEENWPASVGLFTGLFAKELIVGTMNSLYSQAVVQEQDEFDFWGGIGEAFGTIPANLGALFNIELFTDPMGLDIGDVSDEEGTAERLDIEPVVFKEMRKRFSFGPNAAFAYLLFVLLYVPCLVALSTAYKEAGWKVTLLQAYYSTMLAWVIATLYFQLTVAHNGAWIMSAFALLGISIGAIFIWSRKTTS